MLNHEQIWTAIDRLAKRHGMSVSRLAKSAGLDPTTFNRSKRMTPSGRLRWPSTESVGKILSATRTSFTDFAVMVENKDLQQTIAVSTFDGGGNPVQYDPQGYPNGPGWDRVRMPVTNDPNAFGLKLTDTRLAPVYNTGDLLIISPAANLRRCDRVAVLLRSHTLLVGELKRRSSQMVELTELNEKQCPHHVSSEELFWIARIVASLHTP